MSRQHTSSEDIQKEKFEKAIAESFSHLRDLSVRDGVQAWYANQIPIQNILPIITQINELAKIVNKIGAHHGKRFSPVEVWGGGQVAQPAKFLNEDPLVNLEQIAKAAPDLELQCLYRGRQCFGFIPVSRDIQEAAIRATAKRGMKVFRIFDMMNDINNVKTGIEIMNALKQEGQDIKIEGAISYISEPEGTKRAWTLDDYGNYAVKMAELGCDEIVIKNYAGVGDKEMPDLIATIRKKLDAADAKFQDIPINLHTHGEKPEILLNAIEADTRHDVKVDVAFGKLADGPSHTDIMKILPLLIQRSLRKQGVELPAEHIEAMLEDHDVGRQIKKIEETIASQLTKFEGKRPPAKSKEQIEHYRMAGGALADPWNRLNNPMKDNNGTPILVGGATVNKINYALNAIKENLISDAQRDPTGKYAITGYQNALLNWLSSVEKRKLHLKDIPTQKQYYQIILEECPALWEKAGRFNTVTPGAKILCDQAMMTAFKKVAREPFTMANYDNEYVNVATGRFGENRGSDLTETTAKFRDALLMYRALKQLSEWVKKSDIAQFEVESIVRNADLGVKGHRPIALKGSQMLDLSHPELEAVLMNTDIVHFKKAVENSKLSDEQKARLQQELTPGKCADPTDGLEAGRQIITALKNEGVDIEDAHRSGKHISNAEDAALLAMMLKERKNGTVSDTTANTLFTTIVTGRPPQKKTVPTAAIEVSSPSAVAQRR